MSQELKWIDALVTTPPEDSLLLVIEDRYSKGRVADIVAGFFAEGEYCIGTSNAGDLLPKDKIVRFWALAVWPHGYDDSGIWRS